MSNEIKTRTVVKDIKVLDKVASGTGHAKNAFINTKDSAVKTQDSGYQSANDYATDKSTQGAQDVTKTVADRFKNPKQKAQQNINKAKEHFKEARQQTPKARKEAAEKAKQTAENANKTADKLKQTADGAKKTAQEAQNAYKQAKQAARQVKQTGKQTVKTVRQAEKTIKTSSKSIKATGKGTIKATQKTVKTAQRSAKTAVKTAKHTAKVAQQSTKAAAKATKAAAQAAKAATKAAIAATKAAVKVTIAMVKAAIAAIKGLIALIAAGGWIAVLVIVIICLIGLIVGSVFGIFFSGEDAEVGGRMMPDVVSELTTSFYEKVEDIKNSNAYDVLDMDAMSINWPEVLAIYAVKVNSDPDNPADVATIDDGKVEKLKGVLDDMVSLSHSLKTETQERTVTDNEGNETTESVSITILTITLTHKTADEMATQYGFNAEQKQMLSELLSPEYNDLWASLLGGYSLGTGEIQNGDASRIPKDIFNWPIGEGFSITSNFGYRKDPFDGSTKYHGGTDIGAPERTPILAAADGVVVVANSSDSWGGGWGYYVKIKHNDTYSTLYAHASRIAVINGQEVKKGQVIAYVGTTGNSTGNHLHFEVYKDGTRTNSLGYFN